MPPDPSTASDSILHSTIVIHPGSLWLRIGRATDASPQKLLHAVARRRKPGGSPYSDGFLPASIAATGASASSDIAHDIDECRQLVSRQLQATLRSDGSRRFATPPAQLAAQNRRSTPIPLAPTPNTSAHPPRPAHHQSTANLEHIIGNTLLTVDASELERDFNTHRPMRRGELNIHAGIGGSLHSVLADLQLIWQHALSELLGIRLSAGSNGYRAVLIVPDCYNRWYLRELMQLLLQRMHFDAAFLVQDHVCATFGAGLPYACVVDCGDEKCSVSCVEDGISHPATRVRLAYGGADVAQVHRWLLRKCGWKRGGGEAGPRQAMLVRRAKEEWCHVEVDVCGVKERRWRVEAERPGEAGQEWLVQCGDEAMVAPLALFHTELLAVTRRAAVAAAAASAVGKKGQGAPGGVSGAGGANQMGQVVEVWVQRAAAQQPDAEDCFDAEYLKETGRKYTREQLDQSSVATMPLLDTSASSATAATTATHNPADTPKAAGASLKRRQSSELLIDLDGLDSSNNGHGSGCGNGNGSGSFAPPAAAGLDSSGNSKTANISRESVAGSGENDFQLPGGQLMALDAAIQRSIEHCGSDELRRKMYGNVLLVGGGMRFAGMAKWLQARLAAQMPKMPGAGGAAEGAGVGAAAEGGTGAAAGNGGVAVTQGGKDGDGQSTVWRGAAIMAGLESAPELFIEAAEWRRGGVRVLRERAPFMW